MSELNNDQIVASLSDNEELRNSIVSNLSENGYSIRTSVQEDDFLKRFEDEKIGPRVKEIAEGIERDVFESSGIAREGQEKYHVYTKRVIGDLKGQIEASRDLQAKYDALKNDKSGEVVSRELEEYKSKIPQIEKKFKEQIDVKNQELTQYKKRTAIESGANGISFNPDLDKNIVDTMVRVAIDELSNEPTDFRDGQLVFIDNTGEARWSEENKYLTANDLLKEKLKSIIEAKREVSGLDAKEPDSNSGDGIVKVVPSDVKTKVGLQEYLLAKGLILDSKEYYESWDKLNGNSLPLR